MQSFYQNKTFKKAQYVSEKKEKKEQSTIFQRNTTLAQ